MLNYIGTRKLYKSGHMIVPMEIVKKWNVPGGSFIAITRDQRSIVIAPWKSPEENRYALRRSIDNSYTFSIPVEHLNVLDWNPGDFIGLYTDKNDCLVMKRLILKEG